VPGRSAFDLGVAPAKEPVSPAHRQSRRPQIRRLRLLDWADASISHPFASLVLAFRFLEEVTMLSPRTTPRVEAPAAFLFGLCLGI
jgi:hypothetical protein